MSARQSTADFYDRWTELFQSGFGDVFQAGILRTGNPPREDVTGSVLALAERAGIEDGDRILDAGCGVCGPATIIARHYPDVRIDGVTNSAAQATIARRSLLRSGLEGRVSVHIADYEELPFPDNEFDVVIFFESTGYSTDVTRLYSEAARVVTPEGGVYVKDVFRRSGPLTEDESTQMRAFDDLWGCIRTKTVDESVGAIRRAGLDVERARIIDDVGTARLAGSMFTLGSDGTLAPTEMGEVFAPRGLDPPIEFAEIYAVKPD